MAHNAPRPPIQGLSYPDMIRVNLLPSSSHPSPSLPLPSNMTPTTWSGPRPETIGIWFTSYIYLHTYCLSKKSWPILFIASYCIKWVKTSWTYLYLSRYILSVQEVLPHFIYTKLLYKMGEDFLDILIVIYYCKSMKSWPILYSKLPCKLGKPLWTYRIRKNRDKN